MAAVPFDTEQEIVPIEPGEKLTPLSGMEPIRPSRGLSPAQIDVGKQVVDFFTTKANNGIGYPEHVAHGIASDLYRESGLQLGVHERLQGGAEGPGRYLAQWADPTRKAGIDKRAWEKGEKIPSLQTQLEFMDWELEHTHGKAKEALLAAQSEMGAADAWMVHYENPKVKNLGNSSRLIGSSLSDSPGARQAMASKAAQDVFRPSAEGYQPQLGEEEEEMGEGGFWEGMPSFTPSIKAAGNKFRTGAEPDREGYDIVPYGNILHAPSDVSDYVLQYFNNGTETLGRALSSAIDLVSLTSTAEAAELPEHPPDLLGQSLQHLKENSEYYQGMVENHYGLEGAESSEPSGIIGFMIGPERSIADAYKDDGISGMVDEAIKRFALGKLNQSMQSVMPPGRKVPIPLEDESEDGMIPKLPHTFAPNAIKQYRKEYEDFVKRFKPAEDPLKPSELLAATPSEEIGMEARRHGEPSIGRADPAPEKPGYIESYDSWAKRVLPHLAPWEIPSAEDMYNYLESPTASAKSRMDWWGRILPTSIVKTVGAFSGVTTAYSIGTKMGETGLQYAKGKLTGPEASLEDIEMVGAVVPGMIKGAVKGVPILNKNWREEWDTDPIGTGLGFLALFHGVSRGISYAGAKGLTLEALTRSGVPKEEVAATFGAIEEKLSKVPRQVLDDHVDLMPAEPEVKAAEPKMEDQQLRPSVIADGKQYDGSFGEQHNDVLKKNGFPTEGDEQRGFVGPDGKWMDRGEAKEWVRQNQPEVHDNLPEGEMHSEPYADAVGQQVDNFLDKVIKEIPDRLKSEEGSATGLFEWIGSLGQRLHDAITIDPIPRLARASREVAEKAFQHAASRIAPKWQAKRILSQIFPDDYHDTEFLSKFADILNKDNVLDIHDTFIKRASDARDKAAKAAAGKGEKFLKESDKWLKLADELSKKHTLNQYEFEVKAALQDPRMSRGFKAWTDPRNGVNKLLDDLWKENKNMDPNTPMEGRGKFTGARINLLDVNREAEWLKAMGDEKKPTPGHSNYGSYRNPNMKSVAFDRMAKGTGEYSTNLENILLNVLGKRWPDVTKLRFYKSLVESGHAVWAEGIAKPDQLMGEEVKMLPVRVTVTSKKGHTTLKERPMWIRKSLYPEAIRVLDTDFKGPDSKILRSLTGVQLMQLSDATTHGKNVYSVVSAAFSQYSKMSLFKGFGIWDAAKRIGQVIHEVSQDGPGIRKEMADMAEAGMIRQPYPHGVKDRIPGIRLIGDLLYQQDLGARIIMRRLFKDFVRKGLFKDDPVNEFNYVMQVGQYNRRLMGPWMQKMKDSGISPFIVAGRNYNRQGRRLVTGYPGAETTGWQAELQMRGNNFLRTALMATVPMIANTIITGSPGGRPGTPLFAVDLGMEEDEKGKHKVLDLAQAFGLRRGLRALGIDAAIEGGLAGHTKGQIYEQAKVDVSRTVEHPWAGPGAAFMVKGFTGKQLDIRGHMDAQKISGGGVMQDVENFRAALESQNPFWYSVARPALVAAGIDQKPDKPYVQNFLEQTFLRPLFSPIGVRDVSPSMSAAELLARTFIHEQFPEGMTPDQQRVFESKTKARAALKKGEDIEDLVSEGPETGGLTPKQVKNLVKGSQRDNIINLVEVLHDPKAAMAVYKVATPDEKDLIKYLVAAKLWKSEKLTLEQKSGYQDILDED